MRTLFLQAPSFDGFDGGAGSRYQARREVRSFWYPTWLAQPAALVENSKLIDAPSHRIKFAQVAEAVRDYGVDGLRFDDTIDVRTFGPGRTANNEGAQLLREINWSYRNTDPRQPGRLSSSFLTIRHSDTRALSVRFAAGTTAVGAASTPAADSPGRR